MHLLPLSQIFGVWAAGSSEPFGNMLIIFIGINLHPGLLTLPLKFGLNVLMDPWLWLKKVKCWTCCSCSDNLSAIHQSNGAAQMLPNILQPREHQEAWMTQFTCFTYYSSGEFKLLIWIQTFQLNSSIKWNIFYCSTLNLQPSVILQMDVGRQPAAVSMSWISSVLTHITFDRWQIHIFKIMFKIDIKDYPSKYQSEMYLNGSLPRLVQNQLFRVTNWLCLSSKTHSIWWISEMKQDEKC